MLAVVFLAISLSIDALGTGLSYSVRGIVIPFFAKFIMSILAYLFSSLSLFAGIALSNILPDNFAKIIGVSILCLMGLWIIFQSYIKKEEKEPKAKSKKRIFSFFIKSMGITINIIRNPQSGDLNGSSYIEPIEAVYIGIALSVDSLGAGVGAGLMGLNNLFIPLTVAVMQYIFITFGSWIGTKLAKLKLSPKIWVFVSGSVLIMLGFIRLF